jgi:hypothetical protein
MDFIWPIKLDAESKSINTRALFINFLYILIPYYMIKRQIID